MQRELRAVNVALPVTSAKTMAQYLEESLVAPKAVATFLGGLGALGVCLAGLGLYAVVAFAVSRRSREIGIRMALGAGPQQVVWTVAREVALLVGAGTGAGLALTLVAILALRGVTVSPPGISPYRPTADPLVLLSLAAFMAVVGLVATYVPARSAARMDPLVALRREWRKALAATMCRPGLEVDDAWRMLGVVPRADSPRHNRHRRRPPRIEVRHRQPDLRPDRSVRHRPPRRDDRQCRRHRSHREGDVQRIDRDRHRQEPDGRGRRKFHHVRSEATRAVSFDILIWKARTTRAEDARSIDERSGEPLRPDEYERSEDLLHFYDETFARRGQQG
jgi:hypothetical protein